MSEPGLLDVTGRLRSPAATPGHWAGLAPPNEGQRDPADPPTVEEIILVMREASPGGYADRTRALIAILSRAGLRISEALALTESDLDARPREQAGRETGNEQRRTEAVPGTGEVRADLARAQRRIDTDEQHAEPGTVDGTERRYRRSLVLHKPDGTRRPVF